MDERTSYSNYNDHVYIAFKLYSFNFNKDF